MAANFTAQYGTILHRQKPDTKWTPINPRMKSESYSRLKTLFERHLDSPDAELAIFEEQLKAVSLPFNLHDQLRVWKYPPYPGFPTGMPPIYLYFVPGTGWGSGKPPLDDPTSVGFVRQGDGIGLNFGCPLRLHYALTLLGDLDEHVRKECLDGLKSATKHLATVEELLWLEVWKNRGKTWRGDGDTSHDWTFTAKNLSIRLEAKFRPSDWPRLTDQGTHRPLKGFFLAKAAAQLPQTRGSITKHIVGITGMAPVDEKFGALCGEELALHPNVDALLYRPLIGTLAVISLNRSSVSEIIDLLHPVNPDRSQPFYPIIWHRESREERIRRRKTHITPETFIRPPPVFLRTVRTLPPKKTYYLPPLPYRYEVKSRSVNGEPKFRVICPFIKKRARLKRWRLKLHYGWRKTGRWWRSCRAVRIER